MESVFVQILHWMSLLIEAVAALWVSVGFVYSFAAPVIRTGLNYFLSKEITDTREDEEREARVVTRTEAPFHPAPCPAQA